MNTIKSALAIFMIAFIMPLFAQNTSIPNVLNLRSARQSGTVIESGKLVGYYIFYFKEKTDKANSTYEVQLFDDNYNSVKKFEITRPKQTLLLEIVFNNEVFMVHFYDRKTGYEFATYDKSGKLKGSHNIPEKEIPSYELQRSTANTQSETENTTIFPMGNKGFVRQTFTKNKKLGYNIVAYNNEAEVLWETGSPETSKLIETADISNVSEELISLNLIKKTSLMTKKYDTYCLLLDAKSGKTVAELSMGTAEEGKKSLLKTFVDEKNNSILLIGEYYKPNDDVLKDKSQGLFIQEITKDGKDKTYTSYAWKGEIDRFKQENIDAEDKKDADKPFYVYFHDVIRSANGNLYLIGEQFKKQVSAAGVASNMLSGGDSDVSNFEILLANMVVIEFDKTNKMTDFDLIQKKKTSVLLPKGASMWNTAFLGYYINSMGWFDYSFTSRDVPADKYTIVYIDANRKEDDKSAKSDVMIGAINITAGERTQTRVPLNIVAKRWWLQPAKPGYISISEYFRKEKKIDLHLEPLQY